MNLIAAGLFYFSAACAAISAACAGIGIATLGGHYLGLV